MNKIYLDYAAATPILPEVKKAMEPYFDERFFNPSATYLSAKRVRGEINGFRSNVAKWLGARPSEVIFTAGGSEANNLVIHGTMSRYPDANIVISAVEHDSVLEPAKQYKHKIAPVKRDGQVDLTKLEKLIDNNTVLVSIIYANNEIGTIQPIKKVAKIVEKARRTHSALSPNPLPLYLHVDACQAANYLDLHVSRLGVDMMTLNSGKIYGPKQAGALFVKAGIDLKPLILGGGQESGARSGTENPAAIAGFAMALDVVQSDRQKETDRLAGLQKRLIDSLPGAQLNGSVKHRLPNNVHLTFPGQDNERLMMALDEAGTEVAVGSACSASKDEPSHVLKAIGLSDDEARASLRITLGRHTARADVEKTAKLISKLVSDKS